MPKRKASELASLDIPNLVVISDTHCGCRLGLCPPEGVKLDDGGVYKPSTLQLKIWAMWTEFWNYYVPLFTRKDKFAVVLNGDAIDGNHHDSTTQVSHNIADQIKIARACLNPIVDKCKGRYYHIRGTEAHVGKSGVEEERLAESLGAIPNSEGQYARWDLWKTVGDGLVHILHHIGTTGSAAYESTAVHKELVEEYVEAGRWGERAPNGIIRAHRHRYFKTEIAAADGEAFGVVCAGWQGRTPFAYKIPGARLSQPQFGGIVVRHGDEDFLFVRKKIWRIDRSPVE